MESTKGTNKLLAVVFCNRTERANVPLCF